MKKNIKIIIAGLIGFVITGCASNQPQPKTQPVVKTQTQEIKKIEAFVKNSKTKSSIKKIAVFDNKPLNIREVNKILLKTNALYAEKYKKEALKENMRLAPNAPLYRPPLFAEMIVYPYVSDDGIYHDTQVVWIKVKNGEFVLNQRDANSKVRVFGINGGY